MVSEYFNRKSDIWDEAVAERDTAKLEQMAERLNLMPGFTLLDVGTGTGVFLPYLLGEIGKRGRIVAIDIAEKMLLKARSKGFDGNIDYLCTDVMAIPLGGEIFDAVVCYSSFPHFQDKSEALAEIYRVLKAGGTVSICHTSSRSAINDLHRQLPVVKNDIIPEADEMRLLMLSAGFTGINIEDGSDSYLATAVKPG
jgi:ubiquinone/menaquinone biosynthesis C-methylase UbiE